VVVVDRQRRIVQVAREGSPPVEAVVDRLGDGGAFGYTLALQGEPVMEGAGDRRRARLPGLEPLLGFAILDQLFNGIKLPDPFDGIGRELALIGDVQFHEVAPGVSQATRFDNLGAEARLVAAEIVANQVSLPVAEEGPGMLAGAAVGEVVDHRLQGFELAGGVGPQIAAVGLAGAGRQHCHRGFVGLHHRAAQQLGFQGIDQGLQPVAGHPVPARQGRARNGQAGAPEDGFLPVERKMIGMLGDGDMGQQPRRGDALVDDVRRHRRLDQGLAVVAHPLAADVAVHGEAAGRVVELFADILADPPQGATTGTGSGFRLVAKLDSRQMGRQRCALGLLLLLVRGLGRGVAKLFELALQRCQVGVEGFVEQRFLGRAQLLALAPELHPPDLGDLEAQLADLGVAPLDLAAIIVDALEELIHQGAQPGFVHRRQLRTIDERGGLHARL